MKKLLFILTILGSMITSQVYAHGHYGDRIRFGINLFPPVYQTQAPVVYTLPPAPVYAPTSPAYVNYDPTYITPACYPGQLYSLEGVMVMGRQPIPIFNYNNQIIGYTCR